MHRHVVCASSVVILALVLAGCSLFHDPVKDLQKKVGVPVQSRTVEVRGGTLTFYRYVKGQDCGEGLYYDFYRVGGGSGSSGPCAAIPQPLTLVGATGDAGEGSTRPFAVIYGQVNDRRITRVMATIEDKAEPVQAQMTDGWWYVFLDGHADVPDVPRVVGLDATGNELFSESWAQAE